MAPVARSNTVLFFRLDLDLQLAIFDTLDFADR